MKLGKWILLFNLLLITLLVSSCEFIGNMIWDQELSLVTTESSGGNCTFGGLALSTGGDKNDNSILDDTEVSETLYVCNDPDYDAVYKVEEISLGEQCTHGGISISVSLGIDFNKAAPGIDPGSVVTSQICRSELNQVVIYGLLSSSDLLRRGETATLSVLSLGGYQAAPVYKWNSAAGFMNSTEAATVTWTAPVEFGQYEVGIKVEGSAGRSVESQYILSVGFSTARPFIQSITPFNAKRGGEIEISGDGFGEMTNTSAVYLDRQPLQDIISWADKKVVARLPKDWRLKDPVLFLFADVAGSNIEHLYLGGFVSEYIGATIPRSLSYDIVPDGMGGTIIAWLGERVMRLGDGNSEVGELNELYINRLDSHGKPVWDEHKALSPFASGKYNPRLMPDGLGGAYISWTERRYKHHNQAYIQHISPDGQPLWDIGGKQLTRNNGNSGTGLITTDGDRGVIAAWRHNEGDVEQNIFVQRLRSNGAELWSSRGVPIDPQGDVFAYLEIISDGAGGSIMAWHDSRNTRFNNWDIFAQRIDSNGNIRWREGGIPIIEMPGNQTRPKLVPDGAGGAIIVWNDSRSKPSKRLGPGLTVYAQHIDTDGRPLWDRGGIMVMNSPGERNMSNPVADGSGGVYIVWSKKSAIYVQHLDYSGKALLGKNGLQVNKASGHEKPQVYADGRGGIIITWVEFKENGQNTYAQHLDSNGKFLWPLEGLDISNDKYSKFDPRVVTDGMGNVIISWLSRIDGQNSLNVSGFAY